MPPPNASEPSGGALIAGQLSAGAPTPGELTVNDLRGGDLLPDPVQVARFVRDLEALTGEAASPERRLGIAVSGGADSLALLLLAAAAYPGSVVAATVDHGLRAEAREEAAAVAGLCGRIGVPHDTLAIPEGFVFGGNLQERARIARYLVLTHWAGSGTVRNARPWRAEWVATGHQRDDVAESFLMRARRGAGLAGLAAMPAARPIAGAHIDSPLLIRPLLGWGRDELAALVAAVGLVPAEDASNVHPRFDRSRVRALIRATPDLPADHLATAARNLRHAEDALEWMAAREWTQRGEVEDYETVWLDPSGLPYDLRRRLVARAIDHLCFEFDMAPSRRAGGLDRLVAALDAGRPATLGGIAARPGQRWRFRAAPPRRA